MLLTIVDEMEIKRDMIYIYIYIIGVKVPNRKKERTIKFKKGGGGLFRKGHLTVL